MWDALWIDVDIATCATPGDYGRIENGAIGVQDGRITWIGPRGELPGPVEGLAAVLHEGEQKWVTPALIDCHTHLVHGGQRAGEFEQRLSGESYADIARAGGGIRSTVAATRAAGEADLLGAALRRLKPLIAEGVTVIEIKSGYGLDLQNELKMLRVARAIERQAPVEVVTTFLAAHAVPPEFDGDSDGYIDFVCDELLPGAVEQGLVDQVDAFCETIAFSPAQVERVFEAAKLFNLPVKLHAEQLSNCGGAELAARFGALSADHLEYLSAAGVRAMAKAGTVAVLLPGAFYTLGETRHPPVARLRGEGVPIALASDCNPGSSPMTSLLLAMNMGCVLFGLTPVEALAGVTRNAARALGLGDRRGTLETGKAADFVIWDIEEPAELAYRLGFNPCVEVIRAGAPTLVR
ncbi:MAG: imidazolonepropionase [Thalassobaculaceae bacterium]|nr:imidazolonepropionase [Thalassobaculaceae bacterium]